MFNKKLKILGNLFFDQLLTKKGGPQKLTEKWVRLIKILAKYDKWESIMLEIKKVVQFPDCFVDCSLASNFSMLLKCIKFLKTVKRI